MKNIIIYFHQYKIMSAQTLKLKVRCLYGHKQRAVLLSCTRLSRVDLLELCFVPPPFRSSRDMETRCHKMSVPIDTFVHKFHLLSQSDLLDCFYTLSKRFQLKFFLFFF